MQLSPERKEQKTNGLIHSRRFIIAVDGLCCKMGLIDPSILREMFSSVSYCCSHRATEKKYWS